MRLRPRFVGALGGLAAAVAFPLLFPLLVGACGFGVNLDGIFGGDAAPPPADGPLPSDAAPDVIGPPPMEATAISAGYDDTCALRVDGTVTCWGYNEDGQLGDGTFTWSSTPVLVKDLPDAAQISVGGYHVCALRKSGTVSCWGYNGSRQLGDGTTTAARIPTPVMGLVDVKHVAAGGDFTCALKTDGTVVCWGGNGDGQLGDGTTATRSQPAPVMGLANVTQLVARANGACALVMGGDVFCWGDNEDGEVGNGAPPTDALVPVKVTGIAGATAIWTGSTSDHTCAATATDVRCWGEGWDGRLGNGSTSTSSTPVVVVGLTNPVQVALGSYFTCAVKTAGALSCWGNNYWRQLPLGDMGPPPRVSTPVDAVGLSGVKQVAGGQKHACALLEGGKISCWGGNVSGALGRNTRLQSSTPLKVTGTLAGAHLSLGEDHTCAVTTGGTLECWGNNDSDQCGLAVAATASPGAVPGLSGLSLVGAGQEHTCVLAGTTVQCFGYNYYGPLGTGNSTSSSTPVTYMAGGPATHVEGGYQDTCVVLQSGEVACSGINGEQQVTQPASFRQVTPVKVQAPAGGDAGAMPLGGVTKVAVGSRHTCALSNGGVYCWGDNGSGQTGASMGSTSPPRVVSLPMPAIAISAGSDHTCALLQGGSVRCWGDNQFGQLGVAGGGGATLRTPPLPQAAKAISAGDEHNCAILADDTLACWGRGTWGQLGNGLRVDSPTPVPVMGLTGVKVVAADNGDHTCAIAADNSVHCWGRNSWGQLGDGTTMLTGTAAPVTGY